MRSFFGSIAREHDGESLTLVMDMNAICHFDEATGLNFFDVVGQWEQAQTIPPAGHLRAIIHAALQEHHPDKTVRDAGKIISTDMEIFNDLMAACMKGVEAGKGKKPKAAA